uniref:NADH-ubiquinone oxidoreductase chain 4L n=1 Tax=Leiodidae sp. BMNH 1274323 TaxID=1796520 RepID=A0A126TE15_9COLE|nr:NADH dehydrogenase subunit 4L [Leiodidae sp. BMNH 1274323]
MKLLKLMLIYMFIFSGILFTFNRKHMLLMLLSLEFIVLSLFMNLLNFLLLFNNELFFLMIFLTMSVCEGALGLSILVSIIRSHGNDYIQSLNMLW